MKILLVILVGILVPVSPLAAALLFAESDSEVMWRLVKDWFFFIGAVFFITGLILAAKRGNDYKELRNLATTRLEKINDLKAEIVQKDAKILFLEHLEEIEQSVALRKRGDKENSQRSKS